jgi:holdfast attachment protein HfaA
MAQKTKHIWIAAAAGAAALSFSAGALAQDYSSSSDYSHPYGMTSGNTNAPVDPSLRDGDGNLELVNGQFLTSSMGQQSGVQNMNPLNGASILSNMASAGSTSSSTSTTGGVGGVSTTGTATAIGNSLNVVTVGNNNTVVVDSHQTNNGNQTATANVSGQ